MSQNLIVKIDLGKHRHPTEAPKGAGEILTQLLEYAGLEGEYTFDLGPKQYARSNTPVLKIGSVTDKGSLELKLKSGDNGSRFIYFLFPPKGKDLTAWQIRNLLLPHVDKINQLYPPKPIQKDNPDNIPTRKKRVSAIKEAKGAEEVIIGTLSGYANDQGQIRRNKALEVIDEIGMEAAPVQIIKHLLREKYLEIVSSEKRRCIYQIRNFIPPVPIDLPKKESLDMSTVSVIEDFIFDVKKYIMGIEDRLNEIRKRLR